MFLVVLATDGAPLWPDAFVPRTWSPTLITRPHNL
jgi:hypothetical protein